MRKRRTASTRTASPAFIPTTSPRPRRRARTKAEVDQIIRWLTGYTQKQFDAHLKKKTDLETFYGSAPKMNPSRSLITGVICGVRVEEIEEPIMQDIRYLDKLIDELAKGKAMEKILRGARTFIPRRDISGGDRRAARGSSSGGAASGGFGVVQKEPSPAP